MGFLGRSGFGLLAGMTLVLISAASLSAQQADLSQPEKYALLVGVSDYPGTDDDLPGPDNDALLTGYVLVERFGFRPENIKLLLNGEGRRDQVIEGFRAHLAQAGPDDIVVFFYSGHGTRLPANYYLSDDEADDRDEALAMWGTAEDNYGLLLDDELGILLDELRARRVLVILDNCNAGTATRAAVADPIMWSERFSTLEPPEGLARLDGLPIGRMKFLPWETIEQQTEIPQILGIGDPSVIDAGGEPSSHVLLAASAEDELAWTTALTIDDSSTVAAGLFSLALLATLAEPLEDTSFDALVAKVSSAVRDYSLETYGTAQTPQAEGIRVREAVRTFLGTD